MPWPWHLRGSTPEACAAVSVGVRPTFGTGRAVLVEAYLLDRDVDLYGQILKIDFLARLRGERRFDSVEALIEQMRLDVGPRPARCAGSRSRPACYPQRPHDAHPGTQAGAGQKFGDGPADTGKAEVQIALMTERINELNSICAPTARTTIRAAGC